MQILHLWKHAKHEMALNSRMPCVGCIYGPEDLKKNKFPALLEKQEKETMSCQTKPFWKERTFSSSDIFSISYPVFTWEAGPLSEFFTTLIIRIPHIPCSSITRGWKWVLLTRKLIPSSLVKRENLFFFSSFCLPKTKCRSYLEAHGMQINMVHYSPVYSNTR